MHSDFPPHDEGIDDPVAALAEARRARGVPDDVFQASTTLTVD